ncbi:M50 family metallopeptidase [Streptomyces carpaticus]|uniref:M50 family metallopeptidase n=1 Tax=Streptomyces TaxID=1883 RepID=UPI001591F04A|nr:M50 family metallopeptidase [Streptomyces harbinensis]QKV71013.1 M50 family metallopeptidase [Streptomyces harbinensis]UWM51453.1 M50 family metallopeptidase [Streptomyces carpaticus]
MTAAAPADYRPVLREGVLLSEPLLHGPRTVHLVRHPGSGQSFEIGVREHFLLARMDGRRTLGDLGAAYAEAYGRRLGDANWRQLLALLGTKGLLADAPEPAGEAAPPPDAARPANRLLRGSLPLVADAAATAARLHRAVRPLLTARCVLPLLGLIAAMELTLALHLGALLDGAATVLGHPVLLAAVFALLWLSTALHELAHGVVAHHHGGTVSAIGLRWRLPMVIMYCTVDNYRYLATRWRRIQIAAAGAVMNALVLLPFFLWWLLAPAGGTSNALAGLLFLGSLHAFTMLIPLPPLDGYTIVSQAAGAAALATSSRTHLAATLRRDRTALAGYPRRARRVYAAYTALAATTVAALLAVLAALVHTLLTR